MSEDFDDVFRGHLLQVERIAGRIVGRGPAAEDVAIEAFARAYARWDIVGRMDCPERWVLKVATNLALDIVKRPKRQQADAPKDESAADEVALRQALVAALRHLPRRQQEVVVLRYIADLPEPEVAKTLRISLGTVKTHLHRAMPELRLVLGSTFSEAGCA